MNKSFTNLWDMVRGNSYVITYMYGDSTIMNTSKVEASVIMDEYNRVLEFRANAHVAFDYDAQLATLSHFGCVGITKIIKIEEVK